MSEIGGIFGVLLTLMKNDFCDSAGDRKQLWYILLRQFWIGHLPFNNRIRQNPPINQIVKDATINNKWNVNSRKQTNIF